MLGLIGVIALFMNISSVSNVKERKSADVVVVPVWQEEKKGRVDQKEFVSLAEFPLKEGDFLGKEGETLLLYQDAGKEKRVLLLGLGEKKSNVLQTLRNSYANAVKALRAKKIKSANFLFPSTDLIDQKMLYRAVFEGTLMANYAFDQLKGESYRKENAGILQHVCFCGVDKPAAALLKKTEKIIASVHSVRDLVNGNADDINVDAFKRMAKEIEKQCDHVKTTILDRKALEKEKMELLLAVGKASVSEPALIILEYRGNPGSKESTAIVGKGITYDTGGLNIKPTGGIETMKCDMAGAAATLEVVRLASHLKLKVNLIGVLAIAENAVGPASYKPGDVYRSRSGKTVEIANTDAEGRLVLADAISYTEDKYAPTQLIDLATLTGGVIVALGEEATGLFSNHDGLVQSLEAAGERTQELLWRLPLYPEYKEYLKSTIADIKNSGPRKASSGLGATFIKEFVKTSRWAHLDIAGTAYLSELKPCHPTPATGVPLRLLIDFLEHSND